MALGTITKPSGASDYNEANKRIRVRDIQCTSGANYTTGGETITATSLGLNTIFEAQPLGLALPSGAATSRTVGFVYSAPNVKMVVHTTASAEAASNSDQSTFTVRVRFVGR